MEFSHIYICVDTSDCQGMQELFVVNSVKLHLTVFINLNKRKFENIGH